MKMTVISDTHLREPVLPGGDVLVHCGDLTENGFKIEVLRQLNYLHEQLDKYNLVMITPGNHDLWAERHPLDFRAACASAGIVCLVNESFNYEGLVFWGSPVVPVYHNWAFNKNQSDRYDVFEKIPENVDVLITHSPALEVLDLNQKGIHIGCSELKERLKEINPFLHLFGHCHESAGYLKQEDRWMINAATKIFNLDVDVNKKTVQIIP